MADDHVDVLVKVSAPARTAGPTECIFSARPLITRRRSSCTPVIVAREGTRPPQTGSSPVRLGAMSAPIRGVVAANPTPRSSKRIAWVDAIRAQRAEQDRRAPAVRGRRTVRPNWASDAARPAGGKSYWSVGIRRPANGATPRRRFWILARPGPGRPGTRQLPPTWSPIGGGGGAFPPSGVCGPGHGAAGSALTAALCSRWRGPAAHAEDNGHEWGTARRGGGGDCRSRGSG